MKPSPNSNRRTSKLFSGNSSSYEAPRYERFVESVREWHAHQDGIDVIELLLDPVRIITCGGDNMVLMWNLEGERIGALYQGSSKQRFVDKEWKFLGSIELQQERSKEKDLSWKKVPFF
jgi:hypothetical protein